jgi:hypothetical protein
LELCVPCRTAARHLAEGGLTSDRLDGVTAEILLTFAAPRTAAGSSSTGWWWIGLAALLGVGLIAGITVVRKILSP